MKPFIKNTLVTLAIVLFFSIGIVLMWSITSWNRSLKWAVTAIYSFITIVLILNRFASFDHPLQYFMKPNITDAVSSLIFLLVPVIAVIVAIATRKKYWIAAIVIAALSLPINLFFFFDQYSCQAEFCGLGDMLASIIVPAVLGIIALIVSLISRPGSTKDKNEAGLP